MIGREVKVLTEAEPAWHKVGGVRACRRDREIKCPHERYLELLGDRISKQIRQHRCNDHIRVSASLPAVVQALAHERRVYFIECAHPAEQVATAIMQCAQLPILVDRQIARIAGDRSEVQTAATHQKLKAGMRNDPYVMAGRPQSGAQRHIRAHVALRTDSDDSNAQVALSLSAPPPPQRYG